MQHVGPHFHSITYTVYVTYNNAPSHWPALEDAPLTHTKVHHQHTHTEEAPLTHTHTPSHWPALEDAPLTHTHTHTHTHTEDAPLTHTQTITLASPRRCTIIMHAAAAKCTHLRVTVFMVHAAGWWWPHSGVCEQR